MMMAASTRYLILAAILCCAAVASAGSSGINANKGNLEQMIDEEHRKCETDDDYMACVKLRAMRFVHTVTSKNGYKFGDVEVQPNGYQAAVDSTARAADNEDFFDMIENYLKGHDIKVDLPATDAKVTVSSRNLANDELNLSINFADDDVNDVVEGKGKKGNIFRKGKKHRLRKMAMPIMVLILLKAITVIPMAIGILKIKAFNALALGFFSFIVSVGLAIFQLCKKIAAEHHHAAHITTHGPWDGRAINLLVPQQQKQYEQIDAAQNLAFKGYV